MTVELYDLAAPNEVVFVLAHLLPLAGTPDHLGAKRWAAGMPLPYRMVTLIPGPSDMISRFSKVRVHTFARDYTTASHEADRTERRMLVLADDPLTNVPLPGGVIGNCASLGPCAGPHREPYAAESVVERFVSEYDLELRFVPVPVT